MPNRRLMILLSTVALAVAWTWLLVRDVSAARWAAAYPVWPVAVLLAVALALSLGDRRSLSSRIGLWSAVVLTGAAFACLHLAPSNSLEARRDWWRDSTQRIANTMRAVGNEVANLETVAGAIGERTRTYVSHTGVDALRADPTGAFALLDSMAQSVSHGESLAPGTVIGLQLFTPDMQRVAWAGWPQTIADVDRVFLKGGKEFSYTRSVSLYQILSHIVPCTDANGNVLAVLLVDMPMEVDYRVNNRFLKSGSLADNMPRIATARVTFDYFAPTGNLPQRLGRLREQETAAREQRQKRIAAASSRPRAVHSALPDTVLTAAFTWADSLLSYGAFPSNVSPEGDVGGDEVLGLSGQATIRSRFGNPLLVAHVVGEPLAHFLASRQAHRAAWGMLFLLTGLLALFAQTMHWITARASEADAGSRVRAAWRFTRAVVFSAFMVALRYALLSFGTSSTRSSRRLFDPSVFATPALGGLMRSTFDLMLTAFFFIVLIYGLVRIFRGAHDDTPAGTAVERKSDIWRVLVSGLVATGAGLGALTLIRLLSETVVTNANPRLLGETMALTDTSVLALHVSLFLMISGLLLAAVFIVWGTLRVLGRVRPLLPCALAFAVTLVFCMATKSWIPALLMAPFLWFVAFAPRIARREDLVSVGIAAFALVAMVSGVGYVYLSRDYDELRKDFVLEKSKEVSDPTDNWKVVILEDVLTDFAQRHEIRQAVRSPENAGRLAFDLWAGSPLSLLGYSCAIHVLNAQDDVVSEFSVDMPYRARISEGGERTDTPAGNRWAVLDLTRSTPQGVVRFYRGVVNIDESGTYEDTTRAMPVIGKVIVDLPFFFESLELAARTGPRTPEVLRNVQQGGVAPRVEEPEALLLARVDSERRITESSSEQLPVGEHISPATMSEALAHEWPLLRSATR
ncbi:MAG TPA: hypothetical protein VFH88_08405 [Candidatus Krumholzibacteria bacterium]|nr:hypothetical protein [Candidatus Krumholzibacteria bacterium]